MAETNGLARLRGYFAEHGMLLCSILDDLPSLEKLGADIADATPLIESGEVFLLRAAGGRSAYITREVFGLLRPGKPHLDGLTRHAVQILGFLRGVEAASVPEIRRGLGLSRPDCNRAMGELQRHMLITAMWEEERKSPNWVTYRWGTTESWEKRHGFVPMEMEKEERMRRLREMLTPPFPDRYLRAMFRYVL